MPEVKATHKYLRTSAYKVREVLDLVRGLPVEEARQVLRFHQRGSARDVLKVLDSAVANAEHNNHIPGEELFVVRCFADEGVTLKRWRPRARGRATRIRKRTSHVTVVVDRMTEDMLGEQRSRDERRSSSRAARVAASRRAQERVEDAAPVSEDVEAEVAEVEQELAEAAPEEAAAPPEEAAAEETGTDEETPTEEESEQ